MGNAKRLLKAVLTGLLSVSVLPPTGVEAAAPAMAEQAHLFGTYDDADSAFSPNGDGRHDTWRVPFILVGNARVTATVRHDGEVVRRIYLGGLDKGSHRVVWDGRRSSGAMVPDGGYDVRLVASTGARQDTLSLFAEVDRVNRGRLVTTRRVVYPKTFVVYDAALLMFVEKGWSPEDATYYGIYQERSRLTVADSSGHVIFADRTGSTETPTFFWEPRYPTLAPEGDYVATLVTEDAAGNRVRRSTRLSVSYDKLVPKVWSTTVAAGQASHYEPFWDGCNGCSETCSLATSRRFPGGLSYGPCENFFTTKDYYSMDLPFAPAQFDEYRVTATGGPTTAGTQDTGWLAVGGCCAVQTPVGDGTTTSPWVGVQLTSEPYLPDLDKPVVWAFGTDNPASYDVASFTVEYLHYVPAP